MERPQDGISAVGGARSLGHGFDNSYTRVTVLYLPSEVTNLLLQIIDSLTFASMLFTLCLRSFDLRLRGIVGSRASAADEAEQSEGRQACEQQGARRPGSSLELHHWTWHELKLSSRVRLDRRTACL
jgi:hypothetical protein